MNWKALKGILQSILQEIMKKNNTWNIKCLVDELFLPLAQQTRVLYCRLTDFMSAMSVRDFRGLCANYYTLSGSTAEKTWRWNVEILSLNHAIPLSLLPGLNFEMRHTIHNTKIDIHAFLTSYMDDFKCISLNNFLWAIWHSRQ